MICTLNGDSYNRIFSCEVRSPRMSEGIFICLLCFRIGLNLLAYIDVGNDLPQRRTNQPTGTISERPAIASFPESFPETSFPESFPENPQT